MKMLKIEHLTKEYGEKKAVDDLSLEIESGEIYGFIGHNGAGKTTTLKSVVGILKFDAGEIYIDGESVQAAPLACKKKIAYIPDNPDLYEFMSGIKYLNFIADVYGVGANQRQEKIPQICGSVRDYRRSCAADRCVFAWNEAEACHHFCVAARSEADHYG